METKKASERAQQDAATLSANGEYEAAFELLMVRRRLTDEQKGLLLDLALLLGRPHAVPIICDGDFSSACLLSGARVALEEGAFRESMELLRRPFSSIDIEMQRVLLLGRIFEEQGKTEKARKIYREALAKIRSRTEKQPEAFLRYEAELLVCLRQTSLANDAYNRAEQAGDDSLELLLGRAALYLDHRAYSLANELIAEALTQYSRHPRVHFLRARLAFEALFSYSQAEKHLQRVFDIDPSNPAARAYQAQLHLRQREIVAAKSALQEIDEARRNTLEVRATQAAIHFFEDEPSLYEESIQQLRQEFPGSSRGYLVVAAIAEDQLRYGESEKLLRKALRLDRRDGSVHAQLGINLIRSGNEARGLIALQRAHELEPFDLRVTNMLNLFEQNIRNSYVEETISEVRYRYPRLEAPVLRRYLPGLIRQAQQAMELSYDVKLSQRVQVEIYSSQAEFAVRTSGLPQTALAGVCFGSKVATISPRSSTANLGMTLWHEMAHVYHLALSKYRVPRFLSEGLAEWETARLKRGWRREMDRQLNSALDERALPPITSMSKAFTYAQSFEDVAIAYYASGKIAEWLTYRLGLAAPAELLRELGKKRKFNDFLVSALDQPLDQVDEDFAAFLREQLTLFRPQAHSWSGMSQSGATGRERAVLLKAKAALRNSDEQNLQGLQAELSALSDPTVTELLIAAKVAVRREKYALAVKILQAARLAGPPSFEVEVLHAQLLERDRENKQAAHESFLRAHDLDPHNSEVLERLVLYYRKELKPDLELKYLRKWAKVSEDDAALQESYLRLLNETILKLREQLPLQSEHIGELSSELKAAAPWRLWSNLFRSSLHYETSRAWLILGNASAAKFEMESALMVMGLIEGVDSGPQLNLLDDWIELARSQNLQVAVNWGLKRAAQYQ